ncbi:MAG TPA: TGS domain-containing protein, partial [Candidatus Avamphibacillus intestinigallinarum]|nr:TGS domain-containing protein [Candidatus Avamphibacillus intestinigallinarum]
MSQIEIIFPDGSNKDFEQGVTGEEIAASISPGLKKQALAVKLDGEVL